MCGICGTLLLDPSKENRCTDLIERMTKTLRHRGPDDSGVWQDRRVSLGSQRLAVIDLSSAGHQPMSNEDGTIQLVYNGEIYNFRELKERFRLVERGHIFRSRTDTEVILHLYEEIGLEMAVHLNGMFAIAIWDSRKQNLYLIRDRFGIKPLFYQYDASLFRFGSEIKAILSDERVPRKPSLQALHDFLTFDYVPGEATAFENIFKVPAGHWMTIHANGKIEKRRYWDFSFSADESIDEKKAVQTVSQLLDAAVERQLIADVPVGVLLSGGMDSSSLLALMQRHTSERIHTFSVGFEDASFNELPYARMMSKEFNTVHNELVITPDLVREQLPSYLQYFDEPYADGSAIPTYYLSQMAKGKVVVVLSGEGGDEVFAGYDTYAAYQVYRWFKRIPSVFRNSFIAPVVNALPVSDKKLSLEFRMKRFLGGLDLPPAQAHLWWRIVLTESQKFNLYTPEVREQFSAEPSERHFVEVFKRATTKDVLSILMQIDSSIFLPDDLMVKNDRMTMAWSLEARVPLTDNELVDFMSRVPSRYKAPAFRQKNILRQAMRGILKPAILNKKKIGLEMPYSRWFKKELKDLLLSYLNPERLAETRLFRPEPVQKLIDEHLNGQYDHGRALWGLVNYMMWLELYIQ